MNRTITFLTTSPFRDLNELANIMVNLRKATAEWNRYYGSAARQKKEYWEKRADEWLEQHAKIDNNENTEVPTNG